MRKDFNLINWNDQNTPLLVPFSEKEQAKELGAKWNQNNKIWYIPVSNPNHKTLSSQYSLFTNAEINLIPETCWCSNLRSMLPKSKWDIVRKKTYSNQGMSCEFCRGKFSTLEPYKKHPVEAHELWDFDDATHTQTLKKVLCLCPDCHLTQHLGLANKKGILINVLIHYAAVKNITLNDAKLISNNAMNTWKCRSEHEWSLNLDWLYVNYPEISEQDITLDR